jgi:hypothetical protein
VIGIDRPPHTVSMPLMDADRFDALSRALTNPGTRRTTLGALFGALVGGALPGRSPEALAAPCLPPGAKPCRKGSQCCSGRCKRKKKCLPCSSGTEYCASLRACVDPTQYQTDAANCGSCGNDCGANACENGECTGGGLTCSPCQGDKVCDTSTGFCTCPAARPVQCDGNSTRCSADPLTDSTRCGLNCLDCGVSSAPGYSCCDGLCVNGCGPNSNGSCQTGPCGTSCTPCTGGKVCCNKGDGTPSQCVDPVGQLGNCPP